MAMVGRDSQQMATNGLFKAKSRLLIAIPMIKTIEVSGLLLSASVNRVMVISMAIRTYKTTGSKVVILTGNLLISKCMLWIIQWGSQGIFYMKKPRIS